MPKIDGNLLPGNKIGDFIILIRWRISWATHGASCSTGATA
jgi:hypothetical protein